MITVYFSKEELLLPDQPDTSSSDEDANNEPAECPVTEPNAQGGCPV